MKALTSLALCLACIALRASESNAPPTDSRLGSPFAMRDRAVLGPDTTRVVVIEFSSFNCAHCRAFHEKVFPLLRERYINTGKVQWVIINASNDTGDRTSPVFLVARGALRQGRYWDLVDSLYQVASRPPGFLAELIDKSPQADRAGLRASLSDKSVREAVAGDFSEYVELRIRGTPTFLLRKLGRDGRWTRAILEDFQTLDYFQQVLDGLLREP